MVNNDCFCFNLSTGERNQDNNWKFWREIRKKGVLPGKIFQIITESGIFEENLIPRSKWSKQLSRQSVSLNSKLCILIIHVLALSIWFSLSVANRMTRCESEGLRSGEENYCSSALKLKKNYAPSCHPSLHPMTTPVPAHNSTFFHVFLAYSLFSFYRHFTLACMARAMLGSYQAGLIRNGGR